jgi:uncharacterized NAD(P)/FAD-binding protein YdhS
MTDIAIIGGGAAGAAVFGELLGRGRARTLHWVVDRPSPGLGVAYATTDDRHLLNVRAAGMGLFAGQTDAFLRHVAGGTREVKGTDFLPRRLFGEFIEAQLRKCMDTARQRGQRFAIHHVGAQRIDGRNGGYAIGLADGNTIEVDAAVMALGALSPRPLTSVTSQALASGAFELDPWQLAAHRAPPRRVVVIGTGLTAVDTLLSASTRWPHAELLAVSRHGRLPFVHTELPAAPYPFQAELNAALLEHRTLPAMLQLVRAAIAEAHDTDWRCVVDGMRPVNAALWQSLDLRGRRQFLRHLRWLWESARHRMAPASAAALQQLFDEQRLQVRAARVIGVDGSGPLQLTLRDRRRQAVDDLQADLVIQATGLDTAVAYSGHPLLSQMLADGLACADPLQLGVAALPDGNLLRADGRPQAGLYALGSLLRGNLWECTALPEIRVAAHQLADLLGEHDCEVA